MRIQLATPIQPPPVVALHIPDDQIKYDPTTQTWRFQVFGVTGAGASISAGTFDGAVTLSGDSAHISDGTFNGAVTLSGGSAYIADGTFNDTVTISGYTASIDGGTLNGTVTISGGAASINAEATVSKLILGTNLEMRAQAAWPQPQAGINGSAILGMP